MTTIVGSTTMSIKDESPESWALLQPLAVHERWLVMDLLRMDNISKAFDGLDQRHPESTAIFEGAHDSMCAIMGDYVTNTCKLYEINKERYQELCTITDQIMEFVEATAKAKIAAAKAPLTSDAVQ